MQQARVSGPICRCITTLENSGPREIGVFGRTIELGTVQWSDSTLLIYTQSNEGDAKGQHEKVFTLLLTVRYPTIVMPLQAAAKSPDVELCVFPRATSSPSYSIGEAVARPSTRRAPSLLHMKVREQCILF